MADTADQPRSARERILETAGTLFYRSGFGAVGIDTIIAQSGVAKMTLYRHFPSKDALIVAYLERANELFWGWYEESVAVAGKPEAQLEALFEGIGAMVRSPQCLGCTFQTAAAEFPTLTHPGHSAALAHKQAVHARLRDLTVGAGLRDPETLADHLALLIDGAWAAVRMYGPDNPARDVAAAARALIAAHQPAPTRKPRGASATTQQEHNEQSSGKPPARADRLPDQPASS